MKKIITYGTYDLLHYGHIRLLERAKALGDYLIVGVTADDFDKSRGKINVQQSLMERIEAVRATGLADEIIIEEYEGQKIDDIKRYDIDIFTVGSDWVGKFDYLKDYCKVIYLPRTEGISSSEIRSNQVNIKLGLVGEIETINKIYNECKFVNGIEAIAYFSENEKLNLPYVKTEQSYEELLENIDAVYIASQPKLHYQQILSALKKGKHVLVESPVTLSEQDNVELFEIAEKYNCALMESIKTAYATAYSRLLLLMKSGEVGEMCSVESTCTRLEYSEGVSWDNICDWGPCAMLPVFHLLGTKYKKKEIIKKYNQKGNSIFTQINLVYDHSTAVIKVGNGVKSEGDLIVSGTEGYLYVPSPWWKTDYFEIRYENQTKNRRYYYQLDGEGFRFELVVFMKYIKQNKNLSYIEREVSNAISRMIEDYYNNVDVLEI